MSDDFFVQSTLSKHLCVRLVVKMRDVMIDFESFGNGKHACVSSVGACYFDRTTGEIGKTLKINIDARTSQRSGGEIDADTVYWWLSQSPEAIAAMVTDLKPIDEAMIELNDFLEGAGAIWSHATFDFVMLTETLKRLNMKPKFGFRAARDIRTLLDLAGKKPPKAKSREGIHHDPLADCIFQVGYCVDALKRLGIV